MNINIYLKSLRCAVRTTVLVSKRGFKRKIIRVESLLKKSIANSAFGLPAMIPAIIIDVLPINKSNGSVICYTYFK